MKRYRYISLVIGLAAAALPAMAATARVAINPAQVVMESSAGRFGT